MDGCRTGNGPSTQPPDTTSASRGSSSACPLRRVQLRPAFGGLVGSGTLGSAPVCFCLPMSYMNRSGSPVGDLSQALGVDSQGVLVIHDDLDLPFGTVRCKARGGHGGHNGLKDIARRIGRDHPESASESGAHQRRIGLRPCPRQVDRRRECRTRNQSQSCRCGG